MGSQASKGGVTAEGKAAAAASPDTAGAKTNGQVGTVTATHPHLNISSHTHTHPTSLSHTRIPAAPVISAGALMPVWVFETHTNCIISSLLLYSFADKILFCTSPDAVNIRR